MVRRPRGCCTRHTVKSIVRVLGSRLSSTNRSPESYVATGIGAFSWEAAQGRLSSSRTSTRAVTRRNAQVCILYRLVHHQLLHRNINIYIYSGAKVEVSWIEKILYRNIYDVIYIFSSLFR